MLDKAREVLKVTNDQETKKSFGIKNGLFKNRRPATQSVVSVSQVATERRAQKRIEKVALMFRTSKESRWRKTLEVVANVQCITIQCRNFDLEPFKIIL